MIELDEMAPVPGIEKIQTMFEKDNAITDDLNAMVKRIEVYATYCKSESMRKNLRTAAGLLFEVAFNTEALYWNLREEVHMPNLIYTALNAFTDNQNVKNLVLCPASDLNYQVILSCTLTKHIEQAVEFMNRYPDGNKGRIKACEAELKRRGE